MLSTPAAEVGDRVQARFADRRDRGDFLPARAAAAVQPAALPTPAEAAAGVAVTVLQARFERLRNQLESAFADVDSRIDDVGHQAELAAARAAHVVAAADQLAAELQRLSSSLPPEVAGELDRAVERFSAHLQSA